MKPMLRLLLVVLLLSTRHDRAAGEPPQPHDGGLPSPPDTSVRVPAGTIRKGTLANKRLIQDAQFGVAAGCATMNLGVPESAEPYVVHEPVGRPGSFCWREKWIVKDSDSKTGEVRFRFEEDGKGSAVWVIEHASRVEDPVVLQAPESEFRARAGGRDGIDLDAAVEADMDRFVRAADEFVTCARDGDADGMIAITSLITIVNEGGAETLKRRYVERFLPRFADTKVQWQESHTLMTDDTGNRGVEVCGTIEDESPWAVYLWVMKEGGTHVVTGVSTTSFADLSRTFQDE